MGNPPSRQKGRRSRAGPGAPTGAAERERERARELVKEVERERERQREMEMRSFREFSTKLPVVLRAPNARSTALGGGVLEENNGTNMYDGGHTNYPHVNSGAVGLLPIKYESGGGPGASKSGLGGPNPPSSMSSMGRIAPLDRGSKDAPPPHINGLPSSRQSSRQGNRQQNMQQLQGGSNFNANQEFGPRLTTPTSNNNGHPISSANSEYYMNGYGVGLQPGPGNSQSNGYSHNSGPYYGQSNPNFSSASFRSSNTNAVLQNTNNFSGNQGQAAAAHLPQLQYNSNPQEVVAGGLHWDADNPFVNNIVDYSSGANPHSMKFNIQNPNISGGETTATAPLPRGVGPGGNGPGSDASSHAHHRTQV